MLFNEYYQIGIYYSWRTYINTLQFVSLQFSDGFTFIRWKYDDNFITYKYLKFRRANWSCTGLQNEILVHNDFKVQTI